MNCEWSGTICPLARERGATIAGVTHESDIGVLQPRFDGLRVAWWRSLADDTVLRAGGVTHGRDHREIALGLGARSGHVPDLAARRADHIANRALEDHCAL